MTHYPPHIKPLPHTTVLLIHYGESDVTCETGFVDEGGAYLHAWMSLPLIPERPR